MAEALYTMYKAALQAADLKHVNLSFFVPSLRTSVFRNFQVSSNNIKVLASVIGIFVASGPGFHKTFRLIRFLFKLISSNCSSSLLLSELTGLSAIISPSSSARSTSLDPTSKGLDGAASTGGSGVAKCVFSRSRHCALVP